MSRIAIGSDHAGFDLKQHFVGVLQQHGHVVHDLGTHSTESCDYPPICAAVGRAVRDGDAELGIVIGKRMCNVSEADAADYIFGYTCVNDVTAADIDTGGGFRGATEPAADAWPGYASCGGGSAAFSRGTATGGCG